MNLHLKKITLAAPFADMKIAKFLEVYTNYTNHIMIIVKLFQLILTSVLHFELTMQRTPRPMTEMTTHLWGPQATAVFLEHPPVGV
jgi:hypothetical protein